MSVLVAVNAVICCDMLWCTAAHPPELRDKAVSRNVLFQRKEAYVGRMPRSTLINIMLPKVQPTSHAFHRMSTGQMRIAALRLWSCRWQYCKSLLQEVMYATDINFHEFPYGYVWLCSVNWMYQTLGSHMGSLKPFHPIGVNKLEPQTCDSGRAHQNVRKDDSMIYSPKKHQTTGLWVAVCHGCHGPIRPHCHSFAICDSPQDADGYCPLFCLLLSTEAVLLAFCLFKFVPSFLLKILSGFYFCF